ncbi:MAG: hypothetical protein HY318_15690 [Armatimonadetes bacterium]|nr:hypothetical protein [Armatimonadota bacterium]
MRTHQRIDERSLAMAKAIVTRIDTDPKREGLARANSVCERWEKQHPSSCNREWLRLLAKPWGEVRAILLDGTDEGRRLRQNSPFCGILTPEERWEIYRRFRDDDSKST